MDSHATSNDSWVTVYLQEKSDVSSVNKEINEMMSFVVKELRMFNKQRIIDLYIADS
jgi:hypothetical protein